MVFSSAVFLLLFLPVVYIANYLINKINKKYSNIFLLIASLIFYAWGEPYYVILMIVSIIINWIDGIIIGKTDGAERKAALVIGVICNVGLLIYFKYLNFFVSIINSVAKQELITIPEILLPIGVSFFTFQAISYIVDVYRHDTEPSSKLINVALYISFFPQLIAGPIVKYHDINKQIENRSVTLDNTSIGFKRVIYGLAKKVLIANVLGLYVDTVHSYDISLIDYKTAWISSILYTLQIYYDFSGYSDMAIGLGKMFGFDICENFNYPYLSTSIAEHFRRWHMSLGSWFRDYVYIPLGGNRLGLSRTIINTVIVFFLTGLWHGANYTFIVWGLFNCLFIIVERLGFIKFLNKHRIFSHIYDILIIVIGWVFFRADSIAYALKYLAVMFMPWKYSACGISYWSYIDLKTLAIALFGILGCGVIQKLIPEKLADKWNDSILEAVFCIILLILSLASISSNTYNPFIYFHF